MPKITFILAKSCPCQKKVVTLQAKLFNQIKPKEVMTREEAVKCLQGSREAKVYQFFNGWVFVENEADEGGNYVIPFEEDEETRGIKPDFKCLDKRIGEWIRQEIEMQDENNDMQVNEGDTYYKLLGYKIRYSIEPIFSEDLLLYTKGETND